jgi:hypothetical protein
VTGPLKLGALPPVRPHGLSTLDVYQTGKPPAPPSYVNLPAVPGWRMCLNDTYGDCTVAGAAHAVMAWNAEVNKADHVPTDAEISSTYFALTGGADSGCVEADVLQTWQRDGLFGNRIAGYAPVRPGDVEGLHQAIAFYGAAYLGVALPASAQQQFANGAPWTVVPGSPIEGGHCVLAVGYSQSAVYVVSWGQTVAVSYPWLAKYLTETWAILPSEFVEAGHGPGAIDLVSLRRDLDAL